MRVHGRVRPEDPQAQSASVCGIDSRAPRSDGALPAPTDIVISVRDGSVDFGVTGLDVTRNTAAIWMKILILHEALGYGSCSWLWLSRYRGLRSGLLPIWSRASAPGNVRCEWRHSSPSMAQAFFRAQGIEP